MSLKDKEKLMDRNHIPRRLKSANHKTNEAERTKNQLRKDATFYVFPKNVIFQNVLQLYKYNKVYHYPTKNSYSDKTIDR